MITVVEHVAWEHLGCWGPALEARGIPVQPVRLYAGDSLPSPEAIQALVVMGGPMNVYEEADYPFLRQEDELIREVVARGIPYLGVCLGAQLLAKALGARVYPNQVKELGFSEVELTPTGRQSPLLSGFPGRFWAFQWHGDTFDMPEGCQRLATGLYCHNQAFRYGHNAYALQFHLETTPEMIADWCRRYPEELAALSLDPSRLEAEARQRDGVISPRTLRLLDNFIQAAGLGATVAVTE